MKRTLTITAALGATALLLAACGSSTGTAAPAATSAAATTATTPSAGGSAPASSGSGDNRGAAFQAFQTCLQQHGVTSPQGFFGRRDGNGAGGAGTGSPQARPSMDAKTQAAFTACRSLLPQGGFFQRNNAQFQAFQTCMTDHGVTLNLPKPGARPSAAPSGPTGQGRRGFFGLDLTNAKTKAAYDTCKVLLPNNGNFRGGPDDQRPSGSIAAVPSGSASAQG